MWTLQPPEITSRETLDASTSQIADTVIRDGIRASYSKIFAAEDSFTAAAADGTCYQLSGSDYKVAGISDDELISLYTRLSRKGSAARDLYDRIKLAAPYRRCPMCGHRPVASVDHYLPKSSFPALAVVPPNLIPVCSDCNHKKSDLLAATYEDQVIHPYFDNVDHWRWLYANVIETAPATVEFYVRPPAACPTSIGSRLERHFLRFQLADLYADQAANEISGTRYQLGLVHARLGAVGVREHLGDLAQSWSRDRGNCWQSALYEAAATSAWFCDRGFDAV